MSEEMLIERAVAWCRNRERSDAEYFDREFAHTLVKNPLLFVAFRAGQRDRQGEIGDLKLDLRAAEDECGVLREDNNTLRQAAAELRERNRKQDGDIIDMREAIRDLTDTITTQGLRVTEQAKEIAALREAVFMMVLECRRPWNDSITAAFKRAFLEHPAVAKVEREHEEEARRALSQPNDRGEIRTEEGEK